MTLDIAKIRSDFPALAQTVHNKPLVYLDNAATTQKPRVMLEALQTAYIDQCANIHRGVHLLSARATKAYEDTRRKVQHFIQARNTHEIIFVRGATEGINLVAHSYAQRFLQAGDEIVLSTMEHHSNIVPWQMLRDTHGIVIKVIPINDAGELDLEAFEQFLSSSKVKLVAVTHVSNALGTVNPIKHIVERAHAVGAHVLVDGAQAAPHMAVNVQDLDCDFYVLSAHKMYGPTGVGALYGREELLNEMPPYQGGGDMIAVVTFEKTSYNTLPYKFEAGTPDIAGVIAWGASLDYLRKLNLNAVAAHEESLLHYGTELLREIPGVKLIGTAKKKAGVLSFVMADVHPHDIGTILDHEGVAIRTGHHCAQPVMQRFGVPSTARASVAVYNTHAELDALCEALIRVQRVFS